MPKRVLIGTVSSTKQDKTVVAEVATRKTHPLYKKKYTRTKKYYIHDEKNEAGVGDTVEFVETPPISKLKRWSIVKVVEKAKVTGEQK